MLELTNISKKYGQTQAVHPDSFKLSSECRIGYGNGYSRTACCRPAGRSGTVQTG